MSALHPTIEVWFDLGFFPDDVMVLDGIQLDDPEAELATEPALVSTSGHTVTVNRGRSRILDEFSAGNCAVDLHNYDREFDPLNDGSSFAGGIVPGKRMSVFVLGHRIFSGSIEDWRVSWSKDGEASAGFSAADGLAAFGRIETTVDIVNGPDETAVNRFNLFAIPWGTNYDTGQTVLQDDTISAGSNALSYLQLVAKSDYGRFFSDRTGVSTFHDRHHNLGTESRLRFVASPTIEQTPPECSFDGIEVESGSDLLFTEVSVERAGGAAQTVPTVVGQPFEDYGARTLTLSGLLMSSNAQALDMAGYLYNIRQAPETRVSRIDVNLYGVYQFDPEAAGLVVTTDIGDVVEIEWVPTGGGDPIAQTLVVEGVSHQITAETHTVSFATSLAEQVAVFTLDDVAYGVLDTSRLAF